MKTAILCLATCLFWPAAAVAETRRALVIGIDEYQPAPPPGAAAPGKPGRWINLDGAVNDALGMKSILVARFGFAEGDIELLTNAAATRAAILAGMQHLIDRSAPGDVAVIFYAGHGSRVRNSLGGERDQWDETVVPADSILGADDIRDKEIGEKLNALLDKEAVVTAIFDSCHSGSISRGPHRKTRDLPPRDAHDVKDGRKLSDPAARGALILSAAQDYQSASEDVETVDGKDIAHGAFSLALFRVLRASRGTDPADRIILSVRAMLQSDGGAQEPSLEANDERRHGPLIGRGPISAGDTLSVPVLRVTGETRLELEGGPALGLAKGSVLTLDGKPALRIQVTAVLGMARVEAKVLDGTTRDLRPGLDRFVIATWVPVSGQSLQIFAPAADRETLRTALREVAVLQATPTIDWVDDLADPAGGARPTHTIFWTGAAWRLLSTEGGAPVDLGKHLSAAGVLAHLGAGPRARLWIGLPAPIELRKALEEQMKARAAALAFAAEPDRAHYVLVGRPRGDEIEYAFVASDLTLPCAAPEGAGRICEPQSGLPPATRWIAGADAGKTLVDLGLRLAKVRGWLTLDSQEPRDFPYSLVLRPENGGATITSGTLHDDERYDLVLEARAAELKRLLVPRFVYVFALSSDGSSTLLFPGADSCGVEARIPYSTSAGEDREAEVKLATIHVGPPFGTDTYVMLTTQEALPSCGVLSSPGVREAAKDRGRGPGATALGRLVEGLTTATRGAGVDTPATWSIERLSFRSAAKGAP